MKMPRMLRADGICVRTGEATLPAPSEPFERYLSSFRKACPLCGLKGVEEFTPTDPCERAEAHPVTRNPAPHSATDNSSDGAQSAVICLQSGSGSAHPDIRSGKGCPVYGRMNKGGRGTREGEANTGGRGSCRANTARQEPRPPVHRGQARPEPRPLFCVVLPWLGRSLALPCSPRTPVFALPNQTLATRTCIKVAFASLPVVPA